MPPVPDVLSEVVQAIAKINKQSIGRMGLSLSKIEPHFAPGEAKLKPNLGAGAERGFGVFR